MALSDNIYYKYFVPKLAFDSIFSDGSYKCILTLPSNAIFRILLGPVNRNAHGAKQLMCLNAYKQLNELGTLDDNLFLCIKKPMEKVYSDRITEESTSGAGTTKRKELHGATTVHALSETWIHQKASVTLQGYKLNFVCDQVDQNYSNFILLVDTTLDEDVACVEIDLYLVDKMVKASVSPCGLIQLDIEQVKQTRLFQEIFFNGLFRKLFVGSKSIGVLREFLLKENGASLWNTVDMYLLLPLEPDQNIVQINWKGVSASALVVKYLRNAKLPGVECASLDINDTSMVYSGDKFKNECDKLDVIHLVTKSEQFHRLNNIIVLSIHMGKIYSVLEVATEFSAHSLFDGISDKSPNVKTYLEYFNKKYGIVLKHPTQPLLLLKQSHNPHNLLSSKLNYEGGSASKGTSNGDSILRKPQNHVYMPLVLLVHIDILLDIIKSIYLLPFLMHRIESLMMASQLRKEISLTSNNSYISNTLVCNSSSEFTYYYIYMTGDLLIVRYIFAQILEAITTLRYCEDFSMERLEHLGDSILKYVVSCCLFTNYLEKHEGQLSALRSYTSCNASLHYLGIKHNIQGFIQDALFDPRRWVTAGQQSVRPVAFKCGVKANKVLIKIISKSKDNSIVIDKACDKGHR